MTEYQAALNMFQMNKTLSPTPSLFNGETSEVTITPIVVKKEEVVKKKKVKRIRPKDKLALIKNAEKISEVHEDLNLIKDGVKALMQLEREQKMDEDVFSSGLSTEAPDDKASENPIEKQNEPPPQIVRPPPKLSVDVSSPQYRLPFEHDWKRELVYRSSYVQSANEQGTPPTRKKAIGEVYYHTPAGKKIRSFKELSAILKKSKHLTVDNFTFSPTPLGLEPHLETVREAKPKGSAKKNDGAIVDGKRVVKNGGQTPAGGLRLGAGFKVKLTGARLNANQSPSDAKKPLMKSKSALDGDQIKLQKLYQSCASCCVDLVNSDSHDYCNTCQQMQIGSDKIEKNDRKRKLSSPISLPPKKLAKKSNVTSSRSVDSASSGSENIRSVKSLQEKCLTAIGHTIINGRKYIMVPKHNVLSVQNSVVINENTPGRIDLDGDISSNTHIDWTEYKNDSTHNGIQKRPVTTNSNHSITASEQKFRALQTSNILSNSSVMYKSLLQVFTYAKVQELLVLSRVCHMWHDLANHQALWRTVKMKNSHLTSFRGLCECLRTHRSRRLDLRKVILMHPDNNYDEMWRDFIGSVHLAEDLKEVFLCKTCPAFVIERLAVVKPDLQVINASNMRCNQLNLSHFDKLLDLRELRIQSQYGIVIAPPQISLPAFNRITTLSLLSIKNLSEMEQSLNNLSQLNKLETLELGDCEYLPAFFAKTVIAKLVNLINVRLEKGPKEVADSFELDLFESLASLPRLERLELIYFDMKAKGSDVALAASTSLHSFMIIPIYVTSPSSTNTNILNAVAGLRHCLRFFAWGITDHFLRAIQGMLQSKLLSPGEPVEKKKDVIPVMEPVAFVSCDFKQTPSNDSMDTSKVKMVEINDLQQILRVKMIDTKVQIWKLPFKTIWLQTLRDLF